MVEFLPVLYLTYMFIAIYFLAFFLLLYNRTRKTLFDSPKLEKHFSVSVLIPAYNEEEVIEDTVNAVLKSDYDNIKEILILDNNSKDKTKQISKKLEKKYGLVKYFVAKKQGKANALNFGISKAKGELFAVVDSDSFPRKDAIRKMVGFFNDEKVGAATCPVLVRNKKRFFEKLQAMEYASIAVSRKFLEGIDAIYVTPGPLALYRKNAVQKVGGFDSNNLTEDIELTWNLASNGWKRKMCLDTKVTTVVPSKFKTWFKQRLRWSMGGTQTIFKYKRHFMKKGILGSFILPFFAVSTFLGVVGLGVFTYLFIQRIISQYLFFKFSFVAETPVLTLNEFLITPSFLNYLGVVLFVFGGAFTLMVLGIIREDVLKKQNIFAILFYMTVYMAIYPLILITSFYKLIRKDMTW